MSTESKSLELDRSGNWPRLLQAPKSVDTRYSEPLTVAREERDFAWRRLKWIEVLVQFEHLIGTAGDPGPLRVLDVGAGFGDFLAHARDRGWSIEGTEQSETAALYAEKNFAINLWDADQNWSQHFDAVCCAFVLEHVPEPELIVERIFSALKPGGVAYFCVPNDFSELQAACPEPEREWWVALEHVNYFDFQSLALLLRQVGFEIVGRSTSFPMEMFLMMGMDYVRNPTVGRACHWMRRAFDEAMPHDVRKRFYETLALSSFGRTAELYAQRPK